MRDVLPEKVVVVCLSIAFSIIWSSAFAVTKIGLSASPPLIFAAIRFLIAGLLMVLVAMMLKHKIPTDIKSILLLLLFGILNNTLYLGFTFLALKTVSSGIVSIISSMNPLFTVALAHFYLGERMNLRKAIGLIFGIFGVVFILQSHLNANIDRPIGILLSLSGVLSLTIGTVMFKKHKISSISLIMFNGMQILLGGLSLLPFALIMEDIDSVTINESWLISMSYLVLVVSCGGTLIWFRLLGKVDASTASSYYFLTPALGIFFGWLLLKEKVIFTDFLGIIPIILGVILVTRSSNLKKFQSRGKSIIK